MQKGNNKQRAEACQAWSRLRLRFIDVLQEQRATSPSAQQLRWCVHVKLSALSMCQKRCISQPEKLRRHEKCRINN